MAEVDRGNDAPAGFSGAAVAALLARHQPVAPAASPPADESSAAGASERPKAAAHTIDRLVSPEMLVALPADERGGCVVVVSGNEALQRVAELGAPWPGLIVTSRDSEPPAALATAELLLVDSTRLALATLSAAFDTRPSGRPGVHGSAVIDDSAVIGSDVEIGPGVTIGAAARVGDGSRVLAGSHLGDGAVIGAGCLLHAHVSVYDGVVLGDRVIVHSGSVIGADGFGYAASPRGAMKIRHLGGVAIGDDVEIGANTAIDRGTLEDSRIGPRTKIDNHCQLGHNVVIGSDCLIAGMAGIAGSVIIGDGVIIGGAVNIADHVTIGSGSRIAGRSGVTKDVPAGETWAGFPARPYRQYARSLYLIDRLEVIWQQLKGHVRHSSAEEQSDKEQNSSEHRDAPRGAQTER